MQQIEETIRDATQYLRASNTTHHVEWSVPLLLARLEVSERYTSALLRCLSDLVREHSAITDERNALRRNLREARYALVWGALADDAEKSRAICERYTYSLEPEQIAQAVVASAKACKSPKVVVRRRNAVGRSLAGRASPV